MTDAAVDSAVDSATSKINTWGKRGITAIKWTAGLTGLFTFAAFALPIMPAAAAAVTATGATVTSSGGVIGSAALTKAATAKAGFTLSTWAQVPLEGLQESVSVLTDSLGWAAEKLQGLSSAGAAAPAPAA